MKKYNMIVTGGTFDMFHKGHESFLLFQFMLSEKVLIGITSDTYIQQYKGEGREAFQTRFKNLKMFLASQGKEKDAEIVQIHDAYIPDVWEQYPIEAIAVTQDTIQGAKSINKKRKAEGKNELPIEIIQTVLADDGNTISSSRIRNGEIDRSGRRYITDSWFTKTIYLPEYLRSDLQKPLGKVYGSVAELLQKNHIEEKQLISVGDMVTKTLQQANIYPNSIVVDLQVQRKPFFTSIDQHNISQYTVITIANAAGSLTPEVFKGVKENIFKKHVAFHIIGEEDLLVLPCILAAPLGYTVVYGQPHEGIIAVQVTEQIKNKMKNIAEKFTFSASK